MTPEQLEFSQRLRPHLGRLAAYVSTRVANQHVDDICSDVIAVAWQKRGQLPSVGQSSNTEADTEPSAGANAQSDPMLGFLIATARFQIQNLERRLRTSDKYLDHFASGAIADSAESVALRDEAAVAAFKTLKAADREILLLAAWDGLTVAQIATALKISTNNAGVKLSRARARLEAALKVEDARH
jgi:RNA polymerase sigma-70 factor (ECF subfamily)